MAYRKSVFSIDHKHMTASYLLQGLTSSIVGQTLLRASWSAFNRLLL